MIRIIERAAFAWGQQIARYSLSVVQLERTRVAGGQHLALGPCIWAGWHRTNLVALAFFRHRVPLTRPRFTFLTTGLAGATALGWMEGIGMRSVRLPKDGTGNPQAALKQMARALREGLDVVIALDGPHGPALRARPGALWLARLTGCPLVVCGCAASPSVSFPRWDRHLIPLPGARVSVVMGEPIFIGRDEPVDEARLAAVAERAHAVNRQARELLAATADRAAQTA